MPSQDLSLKILISESQIELGICIFALCDFFFVKEISENTDLDHLFI